VGAVLSGAHRVASNVVNDRDWSEGLADAVVRGAAVPMIAAAAVVALPATAGAVVVGAVGIGAAAVASVGLAALEAPEGQAGEACVDALTGMVPFLNTATHDYENDPSVSNPDGQRAVDGVFDALGVVATLLGARKAARARRAGANKPKGDTPPPKSKAPRKGELTDDQLQKAADDIHDASYKDGAKNKDQTTTTVTQGVDKDGNVAHTVTHSYGTLPKSGQAKAKQTLGPNTKFPKHKRGKEPNGGNHGEQRGIKATEGQTERKQASSSGTPESRAKGHHGGAACTDCHPAQQSAGVTNVTGSQPPNGTGRIR
jgi:hypothetical protein